MIFKNRQEAGKKLAKVLAYYRGKNAVVYALPRGGVVLGYEIARELGIPLDLVITRKIGHPLSPEYAVCATAEDGDMMCNEAERAQLDAKWLREQSEREQQEARRRREVYLKQRARISPEGKIAIIVDDGIATGLSMSLAIYEIKHQNPDRIVAAVPVAPSDVAQRIKKEANELVALDIPEIYAGAVGAYYEEFPQVADEEVIRIFESLGQ